MLPGFNSLSIIHALSSLPLVTHASTLGWMSRHHLVYMFSVYATALVVFWFTFSTFCSSWF